MSIRCCLKLMNKMPVFIKVDQYEDVLDLLEVVRQKIDTAKNTLSHIQELKLQEDAKLQEWSTHLQDVERKLSSVHNRLGEPNQ